MSTGSGLPHKWPRRGLQLCKAVVNYMNERANTPVGWAETVLAKRQGTYPSDPRSKVEGWQGESDGEANAWRWLED